MFTLRLPSLWLALCLTIEFVTGQTPPGFEPSTATSLGVAFDNDTALLFPGMELSSQGMCLAFVANGRYRI